MKEKIFGVSTINDIGSPVDDSSCNCCFLQNLVIKEPAHWSAIQQAILSTRTLSRDECPRHFPFRIKLPRSHAQGASFITTLRSHCESPIPIEVGQPILEFPLSCARHLEKNPCGDYRPSEWWITNRFRQWEDGGALCKGLWAHGAKAHFRKFGTGVSCSCVGVTTLCTQPKK